MPSSTPKTKATRRTSRKQRGGTVTFNGNRAEVSVSAADVKNNTNNIEACTVCITHFRDGDPALIVLPCNHIFHTECITTFFSYNEMKNARPETDRRIHDVCPTCRAETQFKDATKCSLTSVTDTYKNATDKLPIVLKPDTGRSHCDQCELQLANSELTVENIETTTISKCQSCSKRFHTACVRAGSKCPKCEDSDVTIFSFFNSTYVIEKEINKFEKMYCVVDAITEASPVQGNVVRLSSNEHRYYEYKSSYNNPGPWRLVNLNSFIIHENTLLFLQRYRYDPDVRSVNTDNSFTNSIPKGKKYVELDTTDVIPEIVADRYCTIVKATNSGVYYLVLNKERSGFPDSVFAYVIDTDSNSLFTRDIIPEIIRHVLEFKDIPYVMNDIQKDTFKEVAQEVVTGFSDQSVFGTISALKNLLNQQSGGRRRRPLANKKKN